MRLRAAGGRPASHRCHDVGAVMTPAQHRSLRVLVAEDHPVNQRLVGYVLKERGHSFALVANGLEALELHARDPFDVILMDGQMPEMDGYAATREIRRREQATGEHIHIIAVTANASKEDRQVCLDAGMDDYIAKPIDPDLLFDMLEFRSRHLAQPQPQPQLIVSAVNPAVTPEPGTVESHYPESVMQDFNEHTALERVRGKKPFLGQLTAMFMAELPKIMRDIAHAAVAEDTRDLERLAHRLRGAAITVSGELLANAAARLERLAAQGSLDGAVTILQQLEQHAANLCGQLEAFQATTRSTQSPSAVPGKPA